MSATRDAETRLLDDEAWEVVRKRARLPRFHSVSAVAHQCLTLSSGETLPDSMRFRAESFQQRLEPFGQPDTLEAQLRAVLKGRHSPDPHIDMATAALNATQQLLHALQADDADAAAVRETLPTLQDSLQQLHTLLEALWCGLRAFDAHNELAVSSERWGLETCGLALSGGGIRSAAVNIGVLQGLQAQGKLGRIDYLSTVSGGGYTGAAWTYLCARTPGDFPFERPRQARGNPTLDWIRRHASYLNPGQGLDSWALVVGAARGILLNLALLVPLLLGIMYLLTLPTGKDELAALAAHLDTLVVGTSLLAFALFMFFESKRERGRQCPAYLRIRPWFWFAFWPAAALAAWFDLPMRLLPANWALWLAGFFALVIALMMIGVSWDWQMLRSVGLWVKKGITIYPSEALAWLLTFGLVAALYPWLAPWLCTETPILLIAALMGMALLAKLVINNVFLAALSASPLRLQIGGHRYFSAQFGDLLKLGTLLTVLGMTPTIHGGLVALAQRVQGLNITVAGLASLSGPVLTAIGWLLRKRGNERSGLVAALLRMGFTLLIATAVVWLYHAATALHGRATTDADLVSLLLWGLIWLVAAMVTDINYVSMHRYYRNRLMEAFFGPGTHGDYKLPGSSSDNLDLCNIDVGITQTPYPIINAMVETVGSQDQKLRKRGGDNFIFSPRHIGSLATNWVSTDQHPFRTTNLATAMAVSGAAVDPIVGHTYSRPLRIVMALLNVRLGYWMTHPDAGPEDTGLFARLRRLWRESWVCLMAHEFFALPNEDSPVLRLTDGGHFENLGLYELVRRRCQRIIVVDAGADPDWTFGDLARACERVRVDFGVDIDIDTTPLQPSPVSGYASTPFVTGRIRYRSGREGTLYYLKTALFPDLPEDVLGYGRTHARFPDEPTGNQFFTEGQFEAYRELGYRASLRLCGALWP